MNYPSPFTTIVAATAPAVLVAAGWHLTKPPPHALCRLWNERYGDVTFAVSDSGSDLLRATVDSPHLAEVLGLIERMPLVP